MSEREIRHRFRLVALGYCIFAAFVVTGSFINYYQTQDIKHTQEQLRDTASFLIQRDCNVVFSTARVFVDFIKKEIALREIRESQPRVPHSIREFDKAEVYYWIHMTLPQLGKVFSIHCERIRDQLLSH